LGLEGKLDPFVDVFKTIHKSVEKESVRFKSELSRVNHVTPTIYLELLSTYKRILRDKKEQSALSISRLQNGLDKLL
jgi:dynein heavy chain